jgi:hypothetical protein
VKRLPLAAVAGLLLGACSTLSPHQFGQRHSPACEFQGRAGTPIVLLEAQAVPSASLLPCVKLLPSGWTLSDPGISLRNVEASFMLDSDRAGPHAVRVVLRPACDTSRATRVPSDEPDTRRYQRVDTVQATRFSGAQLYVFAGGCVTYLYDFHQGARAGPISEVTQALGFVTRDQLRKQVLDDTGGRYQLDPPGQGG